MAVLASQKVRLITHRDHEEELFDFLQKQEIFHVIRAPEDRAIDRRHGTHMWAKLEAAVQTLEPYMEERKSGLSSILVGDRVPASHYDVEEKVLAFDFQEVLREIEELLEKKQQAGNALMRIREKEMVLEEWKDVDFVPSFQSEQFSFFFVRIPRLVEADLPQALGALPETVHFELLKKTEFALLGLLIFQSEEEAVVRQFVGSVHGNEIVFSSGDVSPQKQYATLSAEKKAQEDVLQGIENRLQNLAQERSSLQLVSDYYFWQKQKEEAFEHGKEMGSVVIFTGWVLEKELSHLQKQLSEQFPATHIETIEPEAGELTPVELRNSNAIRPFEIVTKIFGLPLSRELDPTPYLAPFFVVFFAFCLTDAGYGILLSIGTLLGLRFLRLDQGTRDMLQLLFWGGIMTIVLGVLFGGWFGIAVEKLPPFLQQLQIFDPIQDLQTKVGPLAFGLGVLQLWVGVILSGITKVKNGNVSEAWQTSFPLAAALVAVVAWPIFGAFGMTGLAESFKYIFLGLLLFMVWGFGYGTKNILVRPLIGIVGILNEAMSWLSNVLSYSRLFALGMATGIIAQVFNQVSFTIGGILPVGINVVMIVFILLFGHALNIGLNLLGAFIHSGRLQFVEFFGKFMEGGSPQFSPLRRQSHYMFQES